ncbi:MAG: hypothetical protein JOZ46_02040 [Candidatus Dormibacteraeota bacterium]|nr:hypothetical protein [Candidatus Dormibacteraeota bacterium]MBV9524576.1 hypothetical protein [Candidatus Dormibacteraeota bacterium]
MRTPLDAFTATRTAKLRELRASGRRDLAGQVAALRKPSVVMWAVNQASAVASADLDEVRAGGRRLIAAQQRLLQGDRAAAAEMEQATQAHRRSIDTLTRRLGMVLTASGHAASDDALRRIAEILRGASMSDEETWLALREGRLTAEPEALSFPDMDVSALKRVEREAAGQESQARDRQLRAAEEELRRAEQVERAAAEQAVNAQRRHEHAVEAVEEARKALSRIQLSKKL